MRQLRGRGRHRAVLGRVRARQGRGAGLIPLELPLSERPPQTLLQRAALDLLEGARAYHIWGRLAWQDIRQRYRRSVLGPFWITISAAAMIGGIGLMYSRLLRQDIDEYIPFLSVGLLVWFFVAALINEACMAFIGAEQLIKQVKLPLTVHVWRVVWRNVIIFGHNVLILVPVFAYYHRGIDAGAVLALFGVLLIALNGFLLGIALGLVCARFRDVAPIVANLVQLAFFLTPVMFQTKALGNQVWIAQVNPFYHFLQIVRAPLLGSEVPVESWIYVLCASLLCAIVTLVLFARYRSRIAYWV
jgi:ABC-type polysaccharide/polyol phosphate export permease